MESVSDRDRAAAARDRPHPTREEVLSRVSRDFPVEVASAVVAVLDEYGFEPRVQHAILMLAGGDIDRLLALVEAARKDYRDVLYWAEYPNEVEAARARSTESLPADNP